MMMDSMFASLKFDGVVVAREIGQEEQEVPRLSACQVNRAQRPSDLSL